MPRNKNCINQLLRVADYLNEQQDTILNVWHQSVRSDKQLQVVNSLSKTEFEGQISNLLRFLNREIRSECILSQICDGPVAGDATATTSSPTLTRKEHTAMQQYGFNRWQHGYNIQQVILEWAHLNQTLVQVLNDYEIICYTQQTQYNEAEDFHPAIQAIAVARLLSSQLCDVGYDQIVTEFYHLQQSEAKGVIQSLSHTLEQTVLLEQTRGQVLREAVHDLKGNLTAIQTAVSLLNNVSPEIQLSVSDILQRGTTALQKMINEMLDLSRLKAGQEDCHVEPFDASDLIREICQNHEPLAQQKSIYLKTDGASCIQVEGDVLKIRRIVQNLLLNALKYTETGGVSVEWEPIDDAHWILRIQDTGPGLSLCNKKPSDLKAERGEGVGLIIVRRLCLLLEAKLNIHSTCGKGTTFEVIWPRYYPNKNLGYG